jgi:hypothetical protein
MCGKAVIGKFYLIYRNFPGKSEKNRGNMIQDWDFNLESTEYAAGMITT